MPNPADSPILASGVFQTTPADLAAVYRSQLRWLIRRPRSLRYLLLLPAVISAVAVEMFVLLDPDWTAWNLSGAVLLSFGGIALLLLLTCALLPRTARRHFRQQKGLHQEWRVEFTRFGLRAMTPSQDGTIAWTEYVGWSQNDEVVLLYQSDHLVQFMPTRALAPEALQTLHELVAHLPRR